MSPYRNIIVREFGHTRRIELRNDVCAGWSWQLFDGMPLTFGESRSLAAAKRASMREAKRRGWTP